MLPSDRFWEGAIEELAAILVGHLTASARLGARRALADLTVSVDWSLVNRAAERWARETALEIAKAITETSREHARSTIGDWIESGGSLDDLTAALEPMFGATRAEMIAQTETTRAFQRGNVEAWIASGVVEGIKWQTAQDELTCEVCGPLAGVTDSLDGDFGGVGQPPAHVRCRCWTLPVVTP